jgi:hypothetical protein
MAADGTPSLETAARVELGCRAFRAAGAAYLFFIGWRYRDDNPLAIADAMRAHQRALHPIPDARILVNRLSRDTVGDAIFSRRDLESLLGDYRLLVVTSDYHVPRVRHVFGRVYGPSRPVAYEGTAVQAPPGALEAEEASLSAFERTFSGVPTGDLGAFLERLLQAHPLYDGTLRPALTIEAGGDHQ